MRTLAWLPFVFLAACGDDGDSSIPDECNPLGGQGCMLPWPSIAYAKTDGGSPTGFRLDIPKQAMPKNIDGISIDSALFDRWDGFSAIGPMIAMFPQGVSPDGLPTFKNPEASLAADSPVALIEIATGQRVPLFAEVDQNETEVTKRALIIRPLARLHPSSRYAVAIRSSVKGADGTALVAPAAFAALRDGKSFDHPRFGRLKEGADAMFAAFETAGIPKADLVLAWEFPTVSDEYLRSDLTAMRTQALGAIGANGANLSFTAETRSNTAQTYKRYVGTYKSPDFLTAGETDVSVMRRDASNAPQMQGLRDAHFAAIIPACVQTQPLPRPTVIFGHGLFGSAEGYLDDNFVAQLAEDHCLVIIAGDFIGLTERQIQLAPSAVNDLNRGNQISEKLAQSVIDFIALEHLAHGPMATAPEFKFGATPVIDTSAIYYIGGSLGGIMGNTIMAYDPQLLRGVLAVPGGNWSLLLERSNAWSLLKSAHEGAYPDPEVRQLNLAMALGMGLEPYDPLTTAAHVTKDPLFGQPAKKILFWYTLGDCLVSNIATEIVAREMGLPLLGPATKAVWGMPASTGDQESGVTVFDDHPTPLPPETNVPPATDNGTHSGINRKPAALREVQRFLLAPFAAANACRTTGGAPAPCDCATGACN